MNAREIARTIETTLQKLFDRDNITLEQCDLDFQRKSNDYIQPEVLQAIATAKSANPSFSSFDIKVGRKMPDDSAYSELTMTFPESETVLLSVRELPAPGGRKYQATSGNLSTAAFSRIASILLDFLKAVRDVIQARRDAINTAVADTVDQSIETMLERERLSNLVLAA